MAYYFTLGGLPLPIPPSSLEIKTPSMNTTVTLINEGEINIPKNQGLLEISFEFLIPTFQKYPFATYQLDGFTGAAINPLLKIVAPLIEKLKSSSGGFLDSILPSIPDVDLNNPTSGGYTAGMMIPLIDAMKKNKLPIQFIVTRMNPKGHLLHSTNIKCLIEDFTYKEDAEEYGFDTMCSISLKEYKPYATKRVKLNEVVSDKPGAKSTKVATVTKKRDSSDKVKKSKITVEDNNTLINEARKNGDSIVRTSIENNIEIPESIRSYDPSNEDEWMVEIFPDTEIGELEPFQESKALSFPTTDVYGNKIEHSSDGFGLPSNYKEPPSLMESVMKKQGKTTYASPSYNRGKY
jgi:hypothetical protein